MARSGVSMKGAALAQSSVSLKTAILNVSRLSSWGLSTLVKEFSAAARIMQSSSKELSTVVADGVLKKKK